MSSKIVIRSGWDRLRYALMFELLLVAITAVALFYIVGQDVFDSVALDLGMMSAIMVYTFVFTLIYDKYFPLVQPRVK